MFATLLLEPASPMPVTPEIRGTGWNDDEMPDTDVDPRLAAGTHIGLARLIRLNETDGFGSVKLVVGVRAWIHEMKSIRYSVVGRPSPVPGLKSHVLLLVSCYLLLCPHELRICR